MEIINGVERRRHWRVEEKLRIVAETERPGVCFADVARRHEVSRSVLWSWRKQVRAGTLAAEPAPVFMPVQVALEPLPLLTEPQAAPTPVPISNASASDAGRIEITLPDGTMLRVGEEIGAVALRRVLTALRG
jgi:transposase